MASPDVMSTYYPIIYDFLVEQARTHANPTHLPHATQRRRPTSRDTLTVRTAGPLEGSWGVQERDQD